MICTDRKHKTVCDRCGRSLKGVVHTTSMLNTECICSECKAEERGFSCYSWASAVEAAEIASGNMNYPGVLEDVKYYLLDVIVDGRHFKFIGDVAIENGELVINQVFIFETNTAGKSLSEFTVTTVTFAGLRLQERDALLIEIARSTQYAGKAANHNVLYMNETIYRYIESCLPSRELYLVGKRELPRYVLGNQHHTVYELLFATDRYVFYSDDEQILMLNADSDVVSDNCFAEDGYFQSLSAVANGAETLLFVNETNKPYIYEQLKEEGWVEKEKGNV